MSGVLGLLPVTSLRICYLLDALSRAYDVLGLGVAVRGYDAFRGLALARIIGSAA